MIERLPNLRHLQMLCETGRCGSVSAAARRLHLSQPAVTQAIARLERFFRARLFQRSPTGVSATAAGGACVLRADRALEQVLEGILGAAPVRGRQEAADLMRSITAGGLEALVAAVQCRGFTPAAQAMGVSRPTIHRAARQLEQALGVLLFERTSFGVSPTREAEHLARHARLALAEIQQARAEIDAIGCVDSGRTVIGAMPLARSTLVPRAVLEFTAQYPLHEISILDGPYESMLDALRRGTADVLIGALRDPAPASDVVQKHLFDDPLALIMRAGHPLARRRSVSVRDLARFPWIAPRAGSPLRRQFDALVTESRIAPIECHSLVAARGILLESDRLMLLSAQQIRHELATGVLAAVPHPAALTRQIGLTTRKAWQPTRAQAALLALLRRHASELAPSRR